MFETRSDGAGALAKGGGQLSGGSGGAEGPEGEVVFERPAACHLLFVLVDIKIF